MDGKTSRGSADALRTRPPIHTVRAWLVGAGLVLGQYRTHEKSNEITAIPELLRVLDLQEVTVAIDAMGCQTEIAKDIIAGGGNVTVRRRTPGAALPLARRFAYA